MANALVKLHSALCQWLGIFILPSSFWPKVFHQYWQDRDRGPKSRPRLRRRQLFANILAENMGWGSWVGERSGIFQDLRMMFVFDICQNGTQNTFFVCRRSLARTPNTQHPTPNFQLSTSASFSWPWKCWPWHKSRLSAQLGSLSLVGLVGLFGWPLLHCQIHSHIFERSHIYTYT